MLVVLSAVHVVDGAEFHRPMNSASHFKAFAGADGLFGLAALQMHKAMLSTALGTWQLATTKTVAASSHSQAAFEIAALPVHSSRAS